jgi:hypothetical protein
METVTGFCVTYDLSTCTAPRGAARQTWAAYSLTLFFSGLSSLSHPNIVTAAPDKAADWPLHLACLSFTVCQEGIRAARRGQDDCWNSFWAGGLAGAALTRLACEYVAVLCVSTRGEPASGMFLSHTT